MKSWKFLLVGWVMVGWIFPLWTSHLWAVRPDQIEKDLTQKKRDLKDIRKELTTTKEKEKKIQRKESSILESLHALEDEHYKKEKELKRMESQFAQTKWRLHQANHQIFMLNQGIKRTREELSSRWIALYKMGRIPPEIFLLTSQSYLDLLKIDKYLRVVIDFDTRLVDTYRYQVALKERYQEELIEDQLQWQRNISEVEQKREEINKVGATKWALLRSIQNQKAMTQKVIEELEGRAKELQALIEKLEKDKKLVIVDASPLRTIPGQVNIGKVSIGKRDFKMLSLIEIIKNRTKEIGAKRIVIDSISSLILQYPDESERRNAILDLFETVTDLGTTSLITTELRATALEREVQAEEFLSHGVIVFHTFNEGGKLIRAIQIEKMRGVSHDHQLRPYKIYKNGIEVFSRESVLTTV